MGVGMVVGVGVGVGAGMGVGVGVGVCSSIQELPLKFGHKLQGLWKAIQARGGNSANSGFGPDNSGTLSRHSGSVSVSVSESESASESETESEW